MTSSDQAANECSMVFASQAVLTSLSLETVKPAMHFVPAGQVGGRFGPENIYFNIPDDAPQADAAITAKASELGSLPRGPTSGLQTIASGYRRIFEGCTIYWSRELGAHEVHGDILAKYNAVGGPVALGLPKTDETPDGIARFNDFELGSIYWTSHTGPMIVRNAIRDRWLPRRSELGYPVRDDHRVALSTPSSNPSAGPIDPKISWSLFENGAVASNPGGTEEAATADVSPELLRRLIRDKFDARFQAAHRNVGLHPPVETTSVSEWKFGDFWASIPRTIVFRLHGFHSNPLIPDTDFNIEIGLKFGFAWPTASFEEVKNKSLIAVFDSLAVFTAEPGLLGIIADNIRHVVYDEVYGAFYRGAPGTVAPDPDHPEVPNGAVFVMSIPVRFFGEARHDPALEAEPDIFDVIPTAAGGLQFVINPLSGHGLLRSHTVQDFIDGL